VAVPLGSLWPRGASRRAVSLAAAVLIVLGGVLGYLRVESPTSVSAAQILRRAAVALTDVGPNSVVHEISIVHVGIDSSNAPHAGDLVTEQWTQLAPNGNPARVDLHHTIVGGESDERLVADAQGVMWTYDPASKTVYKSSWTPGQPLFQPPPPSDPMAILLLAKQTTNAPQDPAAMRALLLAAAKGTALQSRLLPQQSLDGRTMDVIEISRSTAGPGWQSAPNATSEVVTIYADASTYLIRRVEMRGLDDRGATVSEERGDVTKYEVLPTSAVPAGTFTFTPPPGTQLVTCSASHHCLRK
jgi:hypothetical protein